MDRRTLFGLAPLALAALATPALARQHHGGGEGAPKASWIALPTTTATITRPDGRRGVMTIEAGVDVPDDALRTRAAASTPRLRAAFNTVAQQTAAALLPGRAPDIDRLGAALQASADSVLGRAGARVLLGTVMVV